MFCESCGSFIPNGQSFCSNCGAAAPKVASQAQQPAPAPAAAPAPVAAPAPAPAPVSSAAPAPTAAPYMPPVAQPVAQSVYQQPSYQPAYQQPIYQQPVYAQPVAQSVYNVQPIAQRQVTRQVPALRPNGLATAGLILGIFGFILSWLPYLGAFLALLALIFSICGLAKKRAGGKGRAVAGLILAILGLLIGGTITYSVSAFVYEYGDDIEEAWNEALEEEIYSTGSGDEDYYYINGDFVNTEDGYVSGVLHIDGVVVEF